MKPGRISLAAFVALGLLSVPLQAGTIEVIVDKLVFAPVDVNAKVGDTVEWVNKDAFAHTATATNGDWNVTLAPKQNGQLVLKKPGTTDYFCKFHPNMKGRVIVAP
ncbi:MAG TPA: cupredoxin domain-containing protein [Pseudolabrys sp.]|nr:cupredoxin domain-containing protein [Pseudolabrys sp.]